MIPPVIVVGAGVGGLSLAHALKRAGREVVVLERAPALDSGSAGVVLHAKTVAALFELGLEREVRAAGHLLDEARLQTRKGRVLAVTSAAVLTAEFGASSLAIEGARFRELLADAVGRVTVKLGFRVATNDEEPDSVTVYSDDGRSVQGSILVGADGIWSGIRSRLVGDGPPRYAGYTSWRGISDAGDLVQLGRTSESWGRGQRFGIISLGDGRAYWFAIADARAGERDVDPIASLRARFDGWHDPIDDILRRTDPARVVRTDIHDRAPIRRWGDGRVALLGDAAHPMTPNLAHGAGQAIEDAVALSRALTRHDSVVGAFREYEDARVGRTEQLARWSRSFGEIAQWSRPLPRMLRDAALRLAPSSLGPFVVFGV
jgi:2-polyprenyl-6-methoxyphenol hydroxylase-like FAD-dependent oxidoreductase